jgi:hypothetical protein
MTDKRIIDYWHRMGIQDINFRANISRKATTIASLILATVKAEIIHVASVYYFKEKH